MRTYPTSTANRNVPSNVYLLAEVTEGECNYTYYADAEGYMWKVGDWSIDNPRPAYMFEVCRLTGDTERMIEGRVSSWQFYRQHPELL